MKVADRLVWDKKRPGMNGGPWRYRHESIYVTEGFVRTNDAAVSILTAFPEQEDHIHGKPLALMEALVGAAPPGLLADPFAGSGSTLVAARNLGRKIIGVELEERYCEIIVRRLSQQAFDFSSLDAS
jgi:site-specific DNA-methyltransferase (adenine-specific)